MKHFWKASVNELLSFISIAGRTLKPCITAEFQLPTLERHLSMHLPSGVKSLTSSFSEAYVTIRLNDKQLIPCRISPNDSLEGLIDALRKRGLIFRADDAILRGFSLMKWKEKALEAMGVQRGDEIHVVETKKSRKVKVRVEALDKVYEVEVASGKNHCADIITKVPLLNANAFQALVQSGLYYRERHKWQRAVSDNSKNGVTYYSEDRNQEITDTQRCLLVVEFLTPRDGLRAAIRGTPCLTLYDYIFGWENDRIVLLNKNAPFDIRYIACVWGYHSQSRARQSLFLQIDWNHYVECLSGTKALSLSKIFNYHKNEGITLHAICILLRENERVPYWQNRAMRHFAVYRRDGVELSILKGRLFRASPTEFVEGTSHWIMRHDFTKFDDDFLVEILRKGRKSDLVA